MATHPSQYSCLANSMDRGAWWTTVHSVAKGQQLTHNTQMLGHIPDLGKPQAVAQTTVLWNELPGCF